MKISRRGALLVGFGVVSTLAIPSIAFPKVELQRKNNDILTPSDELITLLKRSGGDGQDAWAAHRELAEVLSVYVNGEIINRVGVPLVSIPDDYYKRAPPRHKSIDIGASCQMRLSDARSGRWRILARTLQLYVDAMVKKTLVRKTNESFISEIRFFNDPCWFDGRQQLGFYGYLILHKPSHKQGLRSRPHAVRWLLR